jgi:hypothetical protein
MSQVVMGRNSLVDLILKVGDDRWNVGADDAFYCGQIIHGTFRRVGMYVNDTYWEQGSYCRVYIV